MKNELPMEIISNGIRYTLQGDYYFPDFDFNPDSLGRWAQMHLAYIKENNRSLYRELLFSGKLQSYLETLDEQAQTRMECIVQQMQASESITEELKARDQMKWVGLMNNIRACAEEIVLCELIYV
ncbi:MAG: TnpV protein [Eubacteriales bacterium]|nr:TnpV protein [Eubacteriales bacterium]